MTAARESRGIRQEVWLDGAGGLVGRLPGSMKLGIKSPHWHRHDWLLRDVESTHLVLLPLPALRRRHWGSFVQNPQQPTSGGVCWAGTLFWIISGPLQVDFCNGTLLREGEIRGLEMLLRTQSCLCEEAAWELPGAHWSIRLPSRLFSHFWVSDELRTPLCSSSISTPGVSSPGN